VHDPEVLILDEPTIGLDPRQIREVRELITDLGGDRTIIMSTHILPEAQEVCERVLIIHRGRIVAEDTTEELTARLSGGEQIRLVLDQSVNAEAAVGALTGVDGVAEAESLGGGAYRISATGESHPRPAIASEIVGRGWPLLEIRPIGLSLEEIFLQLTDEGDPETSEHEADDAVEDQDAPEAEGTDATEDEPREAESDVDDAEEEPNA
jgi:ABC-2 type transport system ATP-binding protein